jgi:hypothetical protein
VLHARLEQVWAAADAGRGAQLMRACTSDSICSAQEAHPWLVQVNAALDMHSGMLKQCFARSGQAVHILQLLPQTPHRHRYQNSSLGTLYQLTSGQYTRQGNKEACDFDTTTSTTTLVIAV